MMKTVIRNEDIQGFKKDANIFTLLMLLVIVTPIPLVHYLKTIGVVIFIAIFVIAMIYAMKIERYKKNNDIQSYKEITAFMDGKRLDEIQKNREIGKRPYQKFLLAIACGLITIVVSILLAIILKMF